MLTIMSFSIKKYLKNHKDDKNPYSGTHLSKIQTGNHQACKSRVFPLLIILHPTDNRYSTTRRKSKVSLSQLFEAGIWLVYLHQPLLDCE